MASLFAKLALAAIALSAATSGLLVSSAQDQPSASNIVNEQNQETQQLQESINSVLFDLRKCESGFRDEAINPNDKDNTPSYGRYQFKPSTLHAWVKRYTDLDIEPKETMNIIMDGNLQERVLIEAIKENGTNQKWWLGQFPACSKKYRFWERL